MFADFQTSHSFWIAPIYDNLDITGIVCITIQLLLELLTPLSSSKLGSTFKVKKSGILFVLFKL